MQDTQTGRMHQVPTEMAEQTWEKIATAMEAVIPRGRQGGLFAGNRPDSVKVEKV